MDVTGAPSSDPGGRPPTSSFVPGAIEREWLAIAFSTALVSVFLAGERTDVPLVINLLFSAASAAVGVVTLVRYGVLAAATASFVNILLPRAPLILDSSRIYPSTGIWLMIVVCALVAAAFYASRAGEPLLGTLVRESV